MLGTRRGAFRPQTPQPDKTGPKPAGQNPSANRYGTTPSSKTTTPAQTENPEGPAAHGFSLNGGEDSFQAAPPKTAAKLNSPKAPPSPAEATNIAALVQANKNPEITKILNDFVTTNVRAPGALADDVKMGFVAKLGMLSKTPEDLAVVTRAKQLIMGE